MILNRSFGVLPGLASLFNGYMRLDFSDYFDLTSLSIVCDHALNGTQLFVWDAALGAV